MRPARATPINRRRIVATALAATTLAALASVHAVAAADPGGCSVRPAADGMPFGPELVDTELATTTGGTALLHRVDCPHNSTTWVWLRIGANGITPVDTFDLLPIDQSPQQP